MKITLVPDGPALIEVNGEWHYGNDERPQSGSGRIALCRCGRTGQGPFCDGTHRKVGFKGPGGEVDLTPA